jgi:hypothetical protein
LVVPEVSESLLARVGVVGPTRATRLFGDARRDRDVVRGPRALDLERLDPV